MSGMPRRLATAERFVLGGQSMYYLLTGIWPLLHYRSFEAVAGRKHDDWLAKTLGALIVAVGASIGLGARPAAPSRATRVLAAGTALALGGASAYYATRGRIPRIYLVDGVVEAALVLALVMARLAGRSR